MNEKIKELELKLFTYKCDVNSNSLTLQEFVEIINKRTLIKKEIRLLKIAEERKLKLKKINLC